MPFMEADNPLRYTHSMGIITVTGHTRQRRQNCSVEQACAVKLGSFAAAEVVQAPTFFAGLHRRELTNQTSTL